MGDTNSDKCITLDLTDNHWQILNAEGTGFHDAKSTGYRSNDCLFDCLAEVTGRKAQDLRNITIKSLQTNAEYYIKFME